MVSTCTVYTVNTAMHLRIRGFHSYRKWSFVDICVIVVVQESSPVIWIMAL
jgi:hypothetical protein